VMRGYTPRQLVLQNFCNPKTWIVIFFSADVSAEAHA